MDYSYNIVLDFHIDVICKVCAYLHLRVQLIPWRREWLPSPGFLPGEFHSQRSLVGNIPWGCKESDMTKTWFRIIWNVGTLFLFSKKNVNMQYWCQKKNYNFTVLEVDCEWFQKVYHRVIIVPLPFNSKDLHTLYSCCAVVTVLQAHDKHTALVISFFFTNSSDHKKVLTVSLDRNLKLIFSKWWSSNDDQKYFKDIMW